MRNQISQIATDASAARDTQTRFVPRSVLGIILAAVIGGVLIVNFVAAPISAPRAGAAGVKATVSPSALMTQAPRDLPVEQYDSH
jgi:hypothetical protein